MSQTLPGFLADWVDVATTGLSPISERRAWELVATYAVSQLSSLPEEPGSMFVSEVEVDR